MKYLLMINVPSGGDYHSNKWPAGDVQAHNTFMNERTKEIEAAGELVSLVILTAPDRAKLVRAGKGGEPITDGVFAESKEFLAGYWLVDVETPERAYAIAARASAAPGLGGLPLNMGIEVRQVMTPGPKNSSDA